MQPWLARDVVRYVGEPVALVVADDRHRLADAAAVVRVGYEPLEPVIGVEQALAGEVLLFPETGSNVVRVHGTSFDGAGFEGCEVVVTRTIVNQRLAPLPLEVRGAACVWLAGRLVVWLPTQNAHAARDLIAAALGAPVRVITPDVGGAFGAKMGADPEVVVLGWAARRLGRPIRWTETRSENLVAMTHGRGQRQTITIGGRRDGTVLAFRLDAVQDAGAYPRSAAKLLPKFTCLMAAGAYRIPVVEARVRAVLTNTTPVASYRGAGRPEATAAIERAMDLFAARIGMDPVAVRRINFIRSFPYTTPTGACYDSGDYHTALDRVLAAGGYRELRAEQERRRAAGDVVALGLGIGCYVEVTGGGGVGEGARVVVGRGGVATVHTGSSPHGQGLASTLTMLVSHRLGVDQVIVRHGDTDLIARGTGTFGSRSLQYGGSAVSRAVDLVVDRARDRAADMLETAAGDVELTAGVWRVRGAPSSRGLTWAELCSAEELAADVWFDDAEPTYSFGAHLSVVEVDTETGRVVLRRMVAVDDAGRVINPETCVGQRHGGLAQGIAQALFEEVRHHPDGSLVDGCWGVGASELPDFELLDMATPTTRNPLGVKGIGESGTIGSAPAVQNAVIDALSHLGVDHLDMPASPMRVWQAIS